MLFLKLLLILVHYGSIYEIDHTTWHNNYLDSQILHQVYFKLNHFIRKSELGDF